MTRKTASRGRKAGAPRAAKSTSRAGTRTGKKTASARAAKPASRGTVERKRPETRETANPGIAHGPDPEELRREDLPAVRAEDDEDLDWLEEDEDPRSQIVEDDDDDWGTPGDDEW